MAKNGVAEQFSPRLGAATQLCLVGPVKTASPAIELKTIDLFAGAGGITEGFREAGYQCIYANDCMPEAIETFRRNHPRAWADCRNIEEVDPGEVRAKLKIAKGELDVLVGGPPVKVSLSMPRSAF